MRDEELMEDALTKFQSEAKSKFMKGILEHNPKWRQRSVSYASTSKD